MSKFVFVLPVSLVCACAANQPPIRAVPMSTVEVPLSAGADPVQMTEVFPPEQQEAPSPKLRELTEDEFTDAFWRVASCYDFHIPYYNHADSIRLVTYEPCLMTGFEQVMNGGPEVTMQTHDLMLQPVRPGIFLITPGVTVELHPEQRYSVPQLCVEPSAVGGTFPESMRCTRLVHEIGTDKFSLIGLVPLYLWTRVIEENTQKDTP